MNEEIKASVDSSRLIDLMTKWADALPGKTAAEAYEVLIAHINAWGEQIAASRAVLPVTDSQLSALNSVLGAVENNDTINARGIRDLYPVEEARKAVDALLVATPVSPAPSDIAPVPAPATVPQQPIGFISHETLAKLDGPDTLSVDEHVRLWHAANPPSRAVVPVFLAAPTAVDRDADEIAELRALVATYQRNHQAAIVALNMPVIPSKAQQDQQARLPGFVHSIDQ